MSKPLQGKTALVTGASRGIGRAAAARLASDGAHVLVHYGASQAEAETLVAELAAAGLGAEAIGADLGDAAAVEDLASRVTASLSGKKLDILVNNAGIADYTASHETTVETLDRLYAVNVRAPFLLTARLAPTLADGGSVIFTSSIVAKTYFPGVTAYAITKGAVDTLVLFLAGEYGPRGIRVNGVAPGAIATDMSAWLGSEDGKQQAFAMQALQRVGQPEDIASVIAFLAGPDSAWVTGQILSASGGSKL